MASLLDDFDAFAPTANQPAASSVPSSSSATNADLLGDDWGFSAPTGTISTTDNSNTAAGSSGSDSFFAHNITSSATTTTAQTSNLLDDFSFDPVSQTDSAVAVAPPIAEASVPVLASEPVVSESIPESAAIHTESAATETSKAVETKLVQPEEVSNDLVTADEWADDDALAAPPVADPADGASASQHTAVAAATTQDSSAFESYNADSLRVADAWLGNAESVQDLRTRLHSSVQGGEDEDELQGLTEKQVASDAHESQAKKDQAQLIGHLTHAMASANVANSTAAVEEDDESNDWSAEVTAEDVNPTQGVLITHQPESEIVEESVVAPSNDAVDAAPNVEAAFLEPSGPAVVSAEPAPVPSKSVEPAEAAAASFGTTEVVDTSVEPVQVAPASVESAEAAATAVEPVQVAPASVEPAEAAAIADTAVIVEPVEAVVPIPSTDGLAAVSTQPHDDMDPFSSAPTDVVHDHDGPDPFAFEEHVAAGTLAVDPFASDAFTSKASTSGDVFGASTNDIFVSAATSFDVFASTDNSNTNVNADPFAPDASNTTLAADPFTAATQVETVDDWAEADKLMQELMKSVSKSGDVIQAPAPTLETNEWDTDESPLAKADANQPDPFAQTTATTTTDGFDTDPFQSSSTVPAFESDPFQPATNAFEADPFQSTAAATSVKSVNPEDEWPASFDDLPDITAAASGSAATGALTAASNPEDEWPASFDDPPAADITDASKGAQSSDDWGTFDSAPATVAASNNEGWSASFDDNLAAANSTTTTTAANVPLPSSAQPSESAWDNPFEPVAKADDSGWVVSAATTTVLVVGDTSDLLALKGQAELHPVLVQAQELTLRERFGEALVLLQESLKTEEASLGPTHLTCNKIRAALGGVMVSLGQNEEAEKILRQCGKVTELPASFGLSLSRAGRQMDALRYFDHVTAPIGKSEVLIRLGRPLDAWQALQPALKAPVHVEALLAASALAGQLAQFQDAENYARLAEEDPSSSRIPEAHRLKGRVADARGLALHKLGRIDEALAQFAAADKHFILAEPCPLLRHLMAESKIHHAHALQDSKKLDVARRLAAEAVELTRASNDYVAANAVNRLGSILAASGQYDESLMHLTRALILRMGICEQHPDVAESQKALGIVNLALAKSSNERVAKSLIKESQGMFQDALKIAEKSLGANHPESNLLRELVRKTATMAA